MIARIRLDLSVQREFDYLVPAELEGQIGAGSRVKVPFGAREVLGSVMEILDVSPRENLKSILKLASTHTLITPPVLKLARWIAGYYCCPLEMALKCVLPESVRKEDENWRELLRVQVLPEPAPFPKLTPRQLQVFRAIQPLGSMSIAQAVEAAQTTTATLRRLEDLGLVGIQPEISHRDPYAKEVILPTLPLELNAEQAVALQAIKASMDASRPALLTPNRGESPAARQAPSPPFLLHGVTGSGKTEVYLQAIAYALERGQGAIVLVPEISLTPQTVERFKARFCAGKLQTLVAVLHSHLSDGERHDEWHKIRQGRARIVIGARSAIFAPVAPLGLIIVDEEHEHSYKQEETPRYHARDVAVMRANMEHAVVVLGTATPSMESFYNVQKGKYRLLEMKIRADDKKMPMVRVVDMRLESYKQKGTPIFSLKLKEAITQRLEKKEQVMLFLNRRGYSTSLQCPKCGYVAGCPNCSVSLTFHRQIQKICCHICGYQAQAPSVCPEPNCRNPEIRYSGLGTEKVEDVLSKLFPQARVRRMDSDTLKRKEDYRKVLGDFRTGKIDILVGTQMIAKGLHFPNVTLVGIVYADLSLHMPDFRASERTFQLLTQVSGRAGRGEVEGEVFIQAFTPFAPAIQYARRHDFNGFYEQEIEFRSQLHYPPISRAALITIKGRNEEKVRITSEFVRKEIEKNLAGIEDLVIAGPAPAPLLRAETFYRHQILFRTRQMTALSKQLAVCLHALQLPEDISLSTDIDPVNLM
jgi:primosomal protein N' (replication factor Y)